MVPLFDGPFEHHNPDVPERDREHAVTHIVTFVTDYLFEQSIRHLTN